MKKMYVAYGSNLNLEQMAFRCPTAEVYGKGVIEDYKLVFNRVASIEPSKGDCVPVGVWMIDNDCEKSLDRYEGFPWCYRKEDVDVKMYDGRIVKGMVYIMNESKRSCPSVEYYNVIMSGYKEIGLDVNILKNALNESLKCI